MLFDSDGELHIGSSRNKSKFVHWLTPLELVDSVERLRFISFELV